MYLLPRECASPLEAAHRFFMRRILERANQATSAFLALPVSASDVQLLYPMQ